MKKQYGYRKLFKKAWCPLFGELPFIEDPPSSPASRCIDIIERARDMWGCPPLSYESSWPNPQDVWFDAYLVGGYTGIEEMVQYSKEKLLSARAIFRRASEIMMHSQIYKGGGQDWYRKQDGTSDLRIAPDQVKDWLLEYHANSTLGVVEKIEVPEIFALVAIHQAWFTLYKLLCNGISEDDSSVIKNVQVTGALLARAQSIQTDKKIEHADKTIKEMIPDTELGIKRRNQLKLCGQNRWKNGESSKLQKIRKKWLAKAKELREKHPHMSCRSIAMLIWKNKKLTKKSHQTVYKYLLKSLK